MGRQDYLLRMIELAGQALRAILRGLRSGELRPAEAAKRLRETASGAGVDLEFMRQVDLDTLVRLVSPTGAPEPGRTWLAAEAFAIDAFCAEAEGDLDACVDACRRALRLYALLDPAIVAQGFPETEDRVLELRALAARLETGSDAW